jgi:hypothetical protein
MLSFARHATNSTAHGRRTSATDHMKFRGKLPAIALTPRTVGVPRSFVFVHIPKNGGASFMRDSASHMPTGYELTGSNEKAAFHHDTIGKLGKAGRRVILLRNPVKLALSQFLHCKTYPRDPRFPGLRSTTTSIWWGGLITWVANFEHSPPFTNFNCYNPVNIQSRFVATNGGAFGPAKTEESANASARLRRAQEGLERDFYFVGLADAYRESVCLFEYSTTRAIFDDAGYYPARCACDKSKSSAPPVMSHVTHGVPEHSSTDVPEEVRRALVRLLSLDFQLYLHALHLLEDALASATTGAAATAACTRATTEALWSEALSAVCEVGARSTSFVRLDEQLASYGRACGLPGVNAPRDVRRYGNSVRYTKKPA